MVADTGWMRDQESMGVWEHRGKVAVVGWGQSHMDRRWDGVSLDRSCGGLSKEACLKAIADAGLSLDDIDGLITSPETRAEQTWAPRPYFDPPYDTEDGLTKASAEWMQQELGLKNVKYLESDAPYIGPMMGQAPRQSVTVCARPPWCGTRWSTSQDGTDTTIRRTLVMRPPEIAHFPFRGDIRAALCSTT